MRDTATCGTRWKWILIAPLALLSGCDLASPDGRAPRAVIEASALQGAAPCVLQFDGSRSAGDAAIVAYEWAFDGVVEAREARCAHTFTASGEHAVLLTVRDVNGRTGSASVGVRVTNAPPLASFSLSDAAPWVNAPVTADATGSIDPEGGELLYRWDFGDGAAAAGPVATHAYSEEGAYTLTLTVRDVAGAEAGATHRILVQKPLPGGGCGGGRPVPL